MLSNLKRLLAVGTATAVALVGFAPAPTAQASASSRAVTRAGAWLKANPATVDDGISGEIASATGLALARKSAPTLRTRVAALEAKAATAVDGKPGAAASLIILVKAMHLNPKSFGGADLVGKLLAGVDSSGQVGSFGSAYGQALAIIALKRAGQTVPPAIVTTLLTFQDTTGAFGYEFNGFNADPDSTALSIQALHLLRGHTTELKKAIAWAKRTQTAKGYWASFSPVDSTGLMASSLKLVHRSSGKAASWLRKQQLKDGGFAAELKTKTSTSNLLATSDAMYLLTGRSLATFSYPLKGYTKSPRPKLSGTAAVGSTLTAKVGTWSPSPTLSITWLRSGKTIAGATAGTYTLTSADLGKKIRVRVTARGIGLKTATEYSKNTKSVRP
ncbi:MAG: hypothetical protein ACOH1Y_05310 [Propionicimonas sp.]